MPRRCQRRSGTAGTPEALARDLAALGALRAAVADPATWTWSPAREQGPPRLAVRWGPPRDPFLRAAAAARVPEAWFVDPRQGWTERHCLPRRGAYRRRELILPGEPAAPPGAAGAVVPWPGCSPGPA